MNTTTRKRLNLFLTPLLMTLLASFVTACASQNTAPIMNNKPTAPISNKDLTAMKWQLVSIAQKGQSAKTALNAGPQASRFNFSFKDGRLSIRGGCNNLGGMYKLGDGNRITMGPMMGTKMACAENLMNADNEILSYISGITDYSINGRALTLTTAFQQRLVFKGTPTPETQFGGKGVRKFIEIRNTDAGLQWREAKYNSNWIRIKDNAAWETVYPGIQGFVPENNREYIVRIFEYTDPATQQAVWVKDMITSNGILK